MMTLVFFDIIPGKNTNNKIPVVAFIYTTNDQSDILQFGLKLHHEFLVNGFSSVLLQDVKMLDKPVEKNIYQCNSANLIELTDYFKSMNKNDLILMLVHEHNGLRDDLIFDIVFTHKRMENIQSKVIFNEIEFDVSKVYNTILSVET